MKKILKYLSLTLPLLAAVGVVILFTILLMGTLGQIGIFVTLYLRFKNPERGIPDITALLTELSPVLMEIANVGIPLIWAVLFFFWYRKFTNKHPVPKKKVFTMKNIGLIAGAALGCQILIEGLMSLILPYFEELAKDYSELMEQAMSGNPILLFISVVILAPISEELLFRGVIQKKASLFAPVTVTILLQALLFGIFHMNIVQGTYAFLGGLVMGYVAYQYKSIIASILLHFFFNALSYVMIVAQTRFMMLLFVVVGAAILVFVMVMVKRECRVSPTAEIQTDAL